MAFDLILTYAGIVFTLVLLEAVLSFDNAAILAVMSRKLPAGALRKRALNLGLIIAYVLRLGAILVATKLASNQYFLALGGVYLVFLFGKHFLGVILHRSRKAKGPPPPAKGMWGLSALTIVVLQIGLVDLAFALDQVVAAVSFTKERALIIVAASLGLVSLRLLAPVISRLMDWLPTLEHIAYVAVGFVGTLLVLEHPFGLHPIGQNLKIGITLAMFVIPVLVKLVFKVPRSHIGEHAQMQSEIEAAQGDAKKP